MTDPIRVLVVGLGHMGLSHALAYRAVPGFEIAGLCTRNIAGADLPAELAGAPRFDDFHTALRTVRPDAVSINTWPDTHAEFAIAAMEAGAHVFVEKPLATTVADAERVVETARRTGRKLVIGYILRHHPSWMQLVEVARTLGKPLVMRMNLNQQSHGESWTWHKTLLGFASPIVDCGVHYVDMMCLMTGAKPVRVSGIGARLTDDIAPGQVNYGHLQVTFDDGSVGWYEAGWGPMMSEVAYFVKDVIGPKGSISIVMGDAGGGGDGKSSDMETHTKTSVLLRHHSEIDARQEFVRRDERYSMADEPGHQALCEREQAFFRDAIRTDADLTEHMENAVASLRIVLAADESLRTGRTVEL
ncbi:MAG TPA: Gfo/Idh/MocA family oxidoreductase [Alphaproteobacteria bacterium]|nr:Gfo/Idh/MocA family oxidoreductase [Alphaproteobacteria bacterium]